MKVAVFYYSQTGQARRVAETLFGEVNDCQVVYKPIVPLEKFGFPWNRYKFFDTFPESRLGLPQSGIEPLDLSDVMDADLVTLVGQSWFLSPSLPLQSFLADEDVKRYLQGRKVVFVNVCRNMWLMTWRRLRVVFSSLQAQVVGHIVLQDRSANLISVLTIVRWLMFGRKEDGWMLPAAGVSEQDILHSHVFGQQIVTCFEQRKLDQLQGYLLQSGAIDYQPSVLFLERIGHRMFGIWAKFIRQKGGYGDQRRYGRLNLFFYYLAFVLYVLSPFAVLFFYLTYPLQGVSRQKRLDCEIG